jgi:TonB family protein
MPVAVPSQKVDSTPLPRLVVELPSRPRVFFGNLRDLVFGRRLPPLELRSAPDAFWPDVFVQRPLPWLAFVQSGTIHVVAWALLIAFTRLFALQARVQPKPIFDQTQVVYYSATEYLPPLDTRAPNPDPPQKADPEYSPQPIISVPPEADNRSQTIVTPPNVKLQHDVALPNVVAWSDSPQKPQLYVQPVPVTPAAEITRLTPQLNSAVVAPPDAAQFSERRDRTMLQAQVVAPPVDVQTAPSTTARFQSPQPQVIAPPSSDLAMSSARLGDINIGHSAVIAPAPALPVAEQSTVGGRRRSLAALGGSSGPSGQVVPPPPSAGGAASAGSGARGRMIALSLHPAVGAPPDPPAGNRRGSFAAGPEGHAGATGAPGTASGTGREAGSGSNKNASSSLPSGLYVGTAPGKSSTVAGEAGPSNPVSPPATNTSPSRVTTAPRASQPGDAAKLTEPERSVFGSRKFYSLSLNMPNLNSAGGSWIIRFAEMKHEASKPDAPPEPADLSQPQATRKVDPAYPVQLMRENVAGTVILYAVIHTDGSVGNVRILRGVDDRLDRFASDAVAQWKFSPATKNGEPVDVEATFQIPFRPATVGTNF